ncbi:MAG: tetratricopeptide repeat protein [Verrucomicrobiales bacterium]|nr:tetratricopeptide repeat protein [Verrucomicrobiales bacterium]
MNDFLLGLISAAFATNQVVAVSNHVARSTGIHLPLVDVNSPVERELRRVMEADETAIEAIDEWIRKEQQLQDQGAGLTGAGLELRIEERLKTVDAAYAAFIDRHPDHVRARLAHGSFLNETGREAEAVAAWEKAREIAPNNPAAWNNLANHFAHRGPLIKAIEYFSKAIELNPAEPVYRRNLATTVFLFRKDARDFYDLPDDQAVLRKSLELYREARRLEPLDFTLATDLAQVYYFLKPQPPEDAVAAGKLVDEGLRAWDEARTLGGDELTRQGVDIHKVRVCLNAGRLEEARKLLGQISHPALDQLRARQLRRLDDLAAGRTSTDTEP